MDDLRHSVSRRQRVLVFTDLVDSVAWKARIGNDAYVERIQLPHDRLMAAIVRETPGAETLKDTGDGFLLSFATSSGAVAACLRFQHELRTRDWKHGPVLARVGIHLGEVNEWEQDASGVPKVTGIAADMAARVMGLALPGQILLTRTVFDDARMYVREHPVVGGESAAHGAPNDPVSASEVDSPARELAPPLEWLAHGQYLFKGSDEPVEIFEVGASGFAPLRPPPDAEKARRNVALGQEVTLGWRPARGLAVPGRENWDLAEKLGEGGFGEVWLGLHRKTRDKRVFKFCLHPERLRGLKREAALFRLLKETFGERDDFARISDWQFERSPYFLEIEYTPDGSLPDWIEKQGGLDRVPLETRLALVAETADALAAAHRAGVLHRDIKPSNILIRTDRAGRPHAVLSDFGIGLVIDRELLSGKGITTAGFTTAHITGSESSRTGTRLYAAPELLEGREPTTQSDLYSLGVVLYQLVVGDLRRALAPGWERNVPDELLKEDIAACVDGDPARRLAGAEVLIQRLRSLQLKGSKLRRQVRSAPNDSAMPPAWIRFVVVVIAVCAGLFAVFRGTEPSNHSDAPANDETPPITSEKLAPTASDRISPTGSGNTGLNNNVAPAQPSIRSTIESAALAEFKLPEIGNVVGIDNCRLCHKQNIDEMVTDRLLRRDFCSLTEANTYYEHDPHSHAYASLESELGKAIRERRKLGDVSQARECLGCHAGWLPGKLLRDEGVTCEACHGAASRWLEPHFKSAEWRQSSPEARLKLGMIPLEDPQWRAHVCMSCHVGNVQEGKILTHDMYTAGHPPLWPIELESFSDVMPRHWRTIREKGNFEHREEYVKVRHGTPFEGAGRDLPRTRSALIGVLAQSRGFLRLANDFARSPDSWPEFAVYDCAFCHHDLKSKVRFDGRPGRPRLKMPSGKLIRIAGRGHDDLFGKNLAELDVISDETTFGDPVKVSSRAMMIVEALGRAAATVSREPIDERTAFVILDQLYKSAENDRLDFNAARLLALCVRTIEIELMASYPQYASRDRKTDETVDQRLQRDRDDLATWNAWNEGVYKQSRTVVDEYLRSDLSKSLNLDVVLEPRSARDHNSRLVVLGPMTDEQAAAFRRGMREFSEKIRAYRAKR